VGDFFYEWMKLDQGCHIDVSFDEEEEKTFKNPKED
jgi:hypothetical protein